MLSFWLWLVLCFNFVVMWIKFLKTTSVWFPGCVNTMHLTVMCLYLKIKTVRLCKIVASELYQFYGIKVSDETNQTALCTRTHCVYHAILVWTNWRTLKHHHMVSSKQQQISLKRQKICGYNLTQTLRCLIVACVTRLLSNTRQVGRVLDLNR